MSFLKKDFEKIIKQDVLKHETIQYMDQKTVRALSVLNKNIGKYFSNQLAKKYDTYKLNPLYKSRKQSLQNYKQRLDKIIDPPNPYDQILLQKIIYLIPKTINVISILFPIRNIKTHRYKKF
jgi:hypothetical protein